MTDRMQANERRMREQPTPLGQARVPCRQCSMHAVCVTLSPDEGVNPFVRRGRLGSGQILFHAGEAFHGVYAVTAGAVKTFATLRKDQQVVDFFYPGDTVGLDAVDSGVYTYTARALSETLVCRVDIDQAEALGDRYAVFQSELIRALGEQLRHEQSQSILFRKQNAEQRIATFLLSLAGASTWNPVRGFDLQLPMARKDIANYLGVAVETLCRLFKRMQDDGLIESDGRRVRLLNVPALNELARPAARREDEVCSA